jgi:hypothetical protein
MFPAERLLIEIDLFIVKINAKGRNNGFMFVEIFKVHRALLYRQK